MTRLILAAGAAILFGACASSPEPIIDESDSLRFGDMAGTYVEAGEALRDAERDIAEAQKELREAEKELEKARRRMTGAQKDMEDARNDLQKAQREAREARAVQDSIERRFSTRGPMMLDDEVVRPR